MQLTQAISNIYLEGECSLQSSGIGMNEETQLAIIIINWNKALDTLDCLSMITEWSGLKAEVIVVDNGSSQEDLS